LLYKYTDKSQHSLEGVSVYLRESSADPYSNKDRIAIETFKDVALTMNLAGIDFVEQRHQNKRVEYDCKVL